MGSTIHRYIVQTVFFPLVVSFVMFTFFLETMDLIQDLIRYLLLSVPPETIFRVQLFYLPTSMVYALPIAILFSVTFSLSQLNANNELITLYSSGISLLRFTLPLLLIGALLSAGLFFFREEVVIDTLRQKNELKRTLLNQEIEKSNNQVSLLQEGGRIVYYAEFYNDVDKRLSDVIIVITKDDNQFEMRLDADSAQWTGEFWLLKNVKIYTYNPIIRTVALETRPIYRNTELNVRPRFFQKVITNVDEMKYKDALDYVEELKRRGLSYRKLLTDLYSRFPLALSPFIVMIMACISGNLFRKNALLMSLLIAVAISILYYFTDLLGSVLASKGYLSPIIGAWFGFAFTLITSTLIYKIIMK